MIRRSPIAKGGPLRIAAMALALAGAILPASAEKPADPARTIDLIDADGLKKEIGSYEGKILVVNFWATWCVPCRDEFPDLVRFANEHAEKVDLLTVSLDDPGMIESDVKPFIASMKAPGRTLVKGPGDPDTFITSVDPKWSGVLPSTFVYDEQGRQAHAVHGPLNYEKLKSLVEPMIAAAR